MTKQKTKAQETKVRDRLTARRVAGSWGFNSPDGGQTFPSRLVKEKMEMKIEYRKDRKFQAMGKNDELEASYDQLVALFDEPNAGPSPDGKITVQWDLKVDGIKVSVWDWKTGGNISENTMWSVWTEDIDAVDALQEFFDDQDDVSENYIDPKSDPMYTFPAKSVTPDMSNAKMDGDRPADEGIDEAEEIRELEIEELSQQELMVAAVEVLRDDGFVVTDHYKKGADYPFGGGRLISHDGIVIGSLTFSGGGVSFGSELVTFFITTTDDFSLLLNRATISVEWLGEDCPQCNNQLGDCECDEDTCDSCGGQIETGGNSLCVTCDYEERMSEEAKEGSE